MIAAFQILGRFFDRYGIKRDDVEIIIRCRHPGISSSIAAGLAREIEEKTGCALKPPLDGHENSGTIDGIPFKIEPAPRG